MTTRLLFLGMALLLALGAGATLAHAALDTSQPAADTAVTGPLREIHLHFSEAVEVGFSRIEVHALDASDVDATDDDAWQRLNGLASVLVSEALGDARGEGSRLDTELASEEARTSDITVELREAPPAGFYVVMWRVLAIDAHTTQGFFVFEYAP